VYLLCILLADKMTVQLIENGPIANTPVNLFDTQCPGSSLADQAEDVVMGEEFGQDKKRVKTASVICTLSPHNRRRVMGCCLH